MERDQHFDVVVVGAGLAGLTAAATAAKAGARTLVVDGNQPGGRASTDERGQFRFNRGAHALYRGGAADAVLDRLGVTVDGVDPPTGGALGRLGDRVGLLPADSRSLVRSRLFGARDKLAIARFLGSMRRWRPEDLAGITIGQWLDSFKLRGDARHLARLLVRTTTYLNDEDTASADVAAGQIVQGLGAGVRYLHGGWATLVESLAAAARSHGAEVRAHAGARTVVPAEPDGDGPRLHVHGPGLDVTAGAVVLAAGPPRASAALLGGVPAAWAGLGPEVEAAALDLGLTRGLVPAIFFGVDRPIYLIDHAATARRLAPEGGGLVHVLRYIGLGEAATAESLRAEMEDHARAAGIEPGMIAEQRFLRRMTVTGATPTPANGGLAGRPGIDSTGTDGVFVAGDWVGPTGWLADAAFASGEAAGHAAASRAALLARRRPARQDVA